LRAEELAEAESVAEDGFGFGESAGDVVAPAGGAGGAWEREGVIEQQLCETIPFGAETPATSEPKPSF